MRWKNFIPKVLFALALVGSMSKLNSTAHANTTYIGKRTVGSATAKIIITTNGATGLLRATDILNYNVILSDGVNRSNLNPNSTYFFQQFAGPNQTDNLFATSQSLSFNFNSQGNHYDIVAGKDGGIYCVQVSGCFSGSPGEFIQIPSAQGFASYTQPGVGNPTLATAGVLSFADVVDGAVSVYPYSGRSPVDWTSFSTTYNLAAKYTQAMKDAYGPDFLKAGMGAAFVPNGGYSLKQAAALGGFDHFNWAQVYYPNFASNGVIDPALGCYTSLPNPCPNRDTLPWYLDERYTVDGLPVSSSNGLLTRLDAWTANPNTLLFSDSPNVPYYFSTCLVGVRANGTGSIISPANCFYWNNLGTGGPATTEGFDGSNSQPGFGGFFNPSNASDQTRLRQLQNLISGVPDPATWALMLLGFGAVGAMMRRQRVTVSHA